MPNGDQGTMDRDTWEKETIEGACSREGTPFQITKSRPQEPLTNDQKIKLIGLIAELQKTELCRGAPELDFKFEYHRLCDLVLEKD